jgi:hypothetical protein
VKLKNLFTYKKRKIQQNMQYMYKVGHFYLTNWHRHKCNILQIDISMTGFTQQAWHPLSYWRNFQFVNTAAALSDSIPHCSLIHFHLTVGSVAIPGIPLCHEWTSARLQWILYVYRPRGHCSSLPMLLFTFKGKCELSFLPVAGCLIYTYIPAVPFILEISGVNWVKYF